MKYKIPSILLTTFVADNAFAQQASQNTSANSLPQLMTDPMNYIYVLTIAVLLSTILVMARVIKLLTWQIAGRRQVTETKSSHESDKPAKPSIWSRINKSLTDSVPVEKEKDVLLNHEYDGIRELDNNLPPWWKYGFYLTIVFAFIYMAHYHVVGSGNVQLEEYETQLKEAEKLKIERLKESAASVDENTVTLMTDAGDLNAGARIYAEKCLVCHGAAGEGNVGPNLTDEYWIHGGNIKDVFKLVKYGFPSKGMLAWQGQLTPVEMQQVSSFIMKLKGTNPPNQKEAQGELYKEQDAIPVAEDSLTAGAQPKI